MRKFKINVNGQSYEVEVEEIGSKENLVSQPATTTTVQNRLRSKQKTTTKEGSYRGNKTSARARSCRGTNAR
jgi:hypothetical protein